ncbi:nuclear transport factor 2 family protein [Kordiimonas marina]|uniref:nuclear transport factor 2 family protein n=1 Tax=Kordiimonas marina TaxID=2872312 RepID=UPI001FF4BCE1|nr:nuclear transport factor 2 family protein [Kordiimonas marina]
MKMRFAFLILMLLAPLSVAQADDDAKAAASTLDRFHIAAEQADWDTYFSLMAKKGVFIGTDASERWTKDEFKHYATATKGWTYKVTGRHVVFSDDGNSAWFDESLTNVKFGACRSTGTLIRENGQWRIAQYALTFPIPNDLADGITQQIQVFEERQKAGQN